MELEQIVEAIADDFERFAKPHDTAAYQLPAGSEAVWDCVDGSVRSMSATVSFLLGMRVEAEIRERAARR